ncbi:MAG: hypothetical protein NVSMB17_07950 [Candidatus Dormibacteria bacterium]
MISETEVYELAVRFMSDVLARVRDDQWGMQLPPTFARRDATTTPTLREVVNYHAYNDAWVPDMLAGRTMEEAGAEKFKGDLLGEDPARSYAAIAETATRAAQALPDLERTVHCSFGDFTAREYLWQANYFAGIRAHDIARATGVEVAMPPALTVGLWEELSPQAEGWRAMGVFPPEVPVPEDAPLRDRLLGMTGRDPRS